MDDNIVTWFIVILSATSLLVSGIGLFLLLRRQKQSFWHHGVRLPSKPLRSHWYLVTLSVGCRPWAGHEGDVYIKLTGDKNESRTFLINGEVHSRLSEAERYHFLHATEWSLGEIEYVTVICGATMRRKQWFLSSIQVEYVTGNMYHQKKWYFPYHEWIEVFLEPVKVTLCGVDPNSDINRRNVLGWLSRCVSDDHLWTSMLASLKYTNFPRHLRFLCSSSHVITSIGVAILLNDWIPNLGPVVLGVYTSSVASLPAYFGEFYFRRTRRAHCIIVEDMDWYKDGFSVKPQRIAGKNVQAIEAPLNTKDDSERLKEYEEHRGLIYSERMFWNWMSKGVMPEEDPYREEVDEIVTAQSDAVTSQRPGKFRQVIANPLNAIKGALAKRRDSQFESMSERSLSQESLIQPMIRANNADVLEWMPDEIIKHVDVGGEGFFVDPTSVWKVDSAFSIDSLKLGGLNFKHFTTIESMPVSEFNKLRQGRRALLPTSDEKLTTMQNWKNTPVNSNATITEMMKRNVLKEVEPMFKPHSLERLSREETELVSMIYFDLATGGYQWSKQEIPDDVYTMTSNGAPDFADVWKTERHSRMTYFLGDVIKRKAMDNEILEDKLKDEKHRQEYPEPIPIARIFSMMLFPEFAKKLTEAYRDMTSQRDMFTAVGEMFSIFGECTGAEEMFAKFCIEVAPSESGRKAFRDVMAVTRHTRAWESLICDVTVRLKYQADNVIRIQEKYGALQSGDGGNSDTADSIKADLLKIRRWCEKISTLGIIQKDCPLTPLPKRDFKRLSRFYHFMLISQDGAVLFGEILLQIASSGGEGRDVIKRLLGFVTSQETGLLRLIELHGEVGASGRSGRLLLLRMYKKVKGQSPYGSKVLKRLAEHAREISAGKMLIADLQIDGLKAHKVAREIKADIDKNLKPLIEKASRNICHVVLHLNAMARCILMAVSHARVVLDDECDDVDLITPVITDNEAKREFDGSKPPWKSYQVCCKLDQETSHRQQPNFEPPEIEKSEVFRWTPSESELTCEVEAKKRSDFVAGDAWQPLDEREKINVYPGHERAFKSPVPYFKCQAELKRNRCEFFLQSRDHDQFYMNFDYKPRDQVPPTPKKPNCLLDVAKKWGRDVIYGAPKVETVSDDEVTKPDDDVKPLASPQPCPDHQGVDCLICSIAKDLSSSEDSQKVVDVMADYITNVPRISTTDLEPVPDFQHVRIGSKRDEADELSDDSSEKAKATDENGKYVKSATSNEGNVESVKSDANSVVSEQESQTTGFPFPSAGCCKNPKRDKGNCDVTVVKSDVKPIVFRYSVKQDEGDSLRNLMMEPHNRTVEKTDPSFQWQPEGKHALGNFFDKSRKDETKQCDSYHTATERVDPLLRTQSNKPITDRKLFNESWMENICDLHKLPKFKCCDTVQTPRVPHECICNRPELSSSDEFQTAVTSYSKRKRKCNKCKVCIGTQQRPACSRYLHPLKAVRCYEEWKENITTSDSGVSLYTVRDVIDSDDAMPVGILEQQALMELMGINVRRNEALDNESVTSSNVCCHVRAARQVPLLHLQGFGCSANCENDKKEKPLDADWWRRHDIALRSVQRCVDEYVRSRGLVARTKEDAKSKHQQSCKVCNRAAVNDSFGSPLVARYSEMLPVLWRPTVREFGEITRNSKNQKDRYRFYRELINSAVESTRTILIAPDLRPTEDDVINPIVTSHHATKLAHFREMMKSFNEMIETVSTLKLLHPAKFHDVNQDFETANDVKTETEKSETKCQEETFLDIVTSFLQRKLCGCVEDCTVALEAPWELPVDEQQVAGKFLSKLIKSVNPENKEELPLEGALQFCAQEYLNETVFRGSTQTCVMRVIEKSNQVKQHLSNVDTLTRLSVMRLLRLSEVVDSSIKNTRKMIKKRLEKVENEEDEWRDPKESEERILRKHISSILHSGHDVDNSTIDDVLIEFERLRHEVRSDMKLSKLECEAIHKLRDDTVDDIIAGSHIGEDGSSSVTSYDAWTDSEVVLRSSMCDVIGDDVTEKSEPKDDSSDDITDSLETDEDLSNVPPEKIKEEKSEIEVRPKENTLSYSSSDTTVLTDDLDIPRPRACPAEPTSQNRITSSLDNTMEVTQSTTSPIDNFTDENTSSSDLPISSDITSLTDDVDIPRASMGVSDPMSDAISTDRLSFVTCVSELDAKQTKHVTFQLNDVIISPPQSPPPPPAPSSGINVKGAFAEKLQQVEGGEAEVATKQALKTLTGRKMLKEVFGIKMTPEERKNAYRNNIRNLLNLFRPKTGYSRFGSAITQMSLLAICLASVAFSNFYAFVMVGPLDHVLLAALPIAIVVFGFIIEPLKCVGVAWASFTSRRTPMFSSHPVFIKSHPTMINRLSLLGPSTTRVAQKDAEYSGYLSSAAEYDHAIYQEYCKNKRRPYLSRDRRRHVPSMAESDVSIDDHAAPAGELHQAEVIHEKSDHELAPVNRPGAISGFRRGAVDVGRGYEARGGFRRGAVDVGQSRRKRQRRPPAPKKPKTPASPKLSKTSQHPEAPEDLIIQEDPIIMPQIRETPSTPKVSKQPSRESTVTARVLWRGNMSSNDEEKQ